MRIEHNLKRMIFILIIQNNLIMNYRDDCFLKKRKKNYYFEIFLFKKLFDTLKYKNLWRMIII